LVYFLPHINKPSDLFDWTLTFKQVVLNITLPDGTKTKTASFARLEIQLASDLSYVTTIQKTPEILSTH